MAATTGIQWCDATFNPWRGCQKVSPGCANCYAETLSHRNPAVLGEWGPNGNRVVGAESYWKQPLKWDREAKAAGERRRVFCASLADVFEDRPELFSPRTRLLGLIADTPHLNWLLLTKRPENVMPFVERAWHDSDVHDVLPESHAWSLTNDWIGGSPPPNVWLGVSVEDQQRADERIPLLLRTPAAVRFLSVEPMLGPIDLPLCFHSSDDPNQHDHSECAPIPNWVICGGESGPNARPMRTQWARDLRDQCQAAGVPFFFKQHGEYQEVRRVADATGCFIADQWTAEIPNNPGGAPYYAGVFPGKYPELTPIQLARCVGKKVAGNLLDGREWQEFPG